MKIFLAGGCYTPMGAFNGYYSDFSAVKLGAVAARGALERAKVSPGDVEELYFGNVISAGQGQNVARQVALGAGLSVSCGAMTINKMCGSGMRAVVAAAQTILSGEASLLVAGGTENMTMAPYLLMRGRSGYRLGNGEVVDAMLRDGLTDAYTHHHMAEYAEQWAKKFGFTREMQDNFAIESFKGALKAHEDGHLRDILAPVEIATKKGTVVMDHDEEPAKFVEAKFRSLKPAFSSDGTITAGNASAISDGAAALVVVGEHRAAQLKTAVSARLIGQCTASIEPENYPIAPVHALRKLSEKLSLKLADVDLFEINEAFAGVPMAAIKELNLPREKVNVFGGAIAVGHPIGMSGARIIVTLIQALKIRKKKLGVACLCIGGGEASAVAVELV